MNSQEMDVFDDRGYLVIQNWMVEGLGLSGSDLLIYAKIFSYSINGSPCYWSNASFARLCGVAKTDNVRVRLRNLEERGYIYRDGTMSAYGTFHYWINREILPNWTMVKGPPPAEGGRFPRRKGVDAPPSERGDPPVDGG